MRFSDIRARRERQLVAESSLTIEPFCPEDQYDAKALVLAGLGEHWGWIDESANPDLDDIATSYADAAFFVARRDGRIVGTGALCNEQAGTARIVRMSVTQDSRCRGIGTAILERLVMHAKASGYHRVVLETTSAWDDAVRFYLAHGFRITHSESENVHFALDL